MLYMSLPEEEIYNEETCKIETLPAEIIEIEHSLYTISKWETKWHVPYLSISKTPLTKEQQESYIRIITGKHFNRINSSANLMNELKMLINDPATATTIKEVNQDDSGAKQVMTSEVIYAYMVIAGIPFEAQHWPLNRLIKLLQVVSEIRNPNKQTMSLEDRKALNAKRLRGGS